MNSNLDSEQIQADFLNEAQELLQIIEQELLSLRAEKTPAKVHNLMRAAHTLKGSSASVGLNNLSQIAHGLEGIFKSLYNPDLVVDEELDTLLFQSYEYLRLAVTEITASMAENDPDVLNRAASILAEVQIKLGDNFNPDAAIPSSVELGFDVVGSIFEVGVKQRLSELGTILSEGDAVAVTQILQNCNEIFIGLAESLNLPGFGAIARLTAQALQVSPERALKIAEIALADLQDAHQAVMEGDRTCGGQPSPNLQAIAAGQELVEPETSNPQGTETNGAPRSTPEPREETLLERDRPILFPLPEELEAVEFSNGEVEQPADEENEEEEEIDRSNFDAWEADSEGIKNGDNGSTIYDKESFNFISYDEETFDLEESDRDPHPTLDQVFGNFDPALLSDFSPATEETIDTEATETEEKEISEPFATPSYQSSPPLDSSPSVAPEVEILDKEPKSEFFTEDREETIEIPASQASKSPSPEKTSSTSPPQTVRVELERLERLNFQAGELLIDQNRQIADNEHLYAAMQDLRSRLQKHAATLAQLRTWGLTMGEPASHWQVRDRDRGSEPEPKPYEPPTPNRAPDFDTLEFDRYGELHLLLQSATEEMVQMEEAIEVFDLCARHSRQIVEKQQRLLKFVRDDLTQVRMQQLGEILNRIERVLQQLIGVYHKSVEFQITGSHVLVDKALAQQLYDPLLHLVRNAFAHGIEEPEVRRERCKPLKGQIQIRAYTQGNRSFIEVSDDGQGINFERIRERVIELERVPPSEAELLSDEELLEFIFQPGFSTAREANDLFGRGVGLDVVRSHLEAMNAHLSVTSQWRRGTTFSIRLPLTLSVAKLLVCQAGSLVYALPSDNIEQIVLLQDYSIKRLGSQRAIQWQQPPSHPDRGATGLIHTVPLHRLADLLTYNSSWNGTSSPVRLSPALDTARDEQPMVMLLRASVGLIGVEVERVLGEQELVIRPLDSAIAPPSYVDGCSILGNSRLALAIDLVGLVERVLGRSSSEGAEIQVREPLVLPPATPPTHEWEAATNGRNGHRALAPAATSSTPETVVPPSPSMPAVEEVAAHLQDAKADERKFPPFAKPVSAEQPWILVVDDSITLRQNLTRTLKRAGYQVLQARDGLEALKQLQHSQDISLIICDLEMPKMNGLEFLNAYRQNPRVRHIPVAILTSRQGEKHRQLALGLGASAYLTKPYLENDLLKTVTEYAIPRQAIA
ncbi:MAG: response regulator [Cyanobacteriota bacterium]|nr:response regulator [Cyanobacteriota bacterium]